MSWSEQSSDSKEFSPPSTQVVVDTQDEKPAKGETHYTISITDEQLAEIKLDDFPHSPSITPEDSSAMAIDTFKPADLSDDECHKTNVPRRLHCLRWFITLFYDKSVDKQQMITSFHGTISQIQQFISRAIACYDEAPLTGRRHIHVAIHFKKVITFESLQKIFGPANHFECISGSWISVVAYVSGPPPKECILRINVNTITFLKPKSPTRQLFETAIQTKNPQEAIATIEKPGNECAMKHFKTALDFIRQTWKPNLNPVFRLKVYICGESGTGKTTLAREICALGHQTSVFSFSPMGQLVGGTDNSDVALFDDLNLSNANIPREFLFQLFDIYEMKIDVKGSSLNYSPRLVVITRCELPPAFERSFGWRQNEIKQFARRMDYIIRITLFSKRRLFSLVDNETWRETPMDKETILHRIRQHLN